MKSEDKEIQSERSAPNLLFKFTEAILSFLQSLNLYLTVSFFTCAVLFFYAGDRLFQSSPPVITRGYDDIAKEIANRVPARLAQNEILQTIHQYNLSWLYLTRQNGSLSPNTLAYTPDIKNYSSKKSRSLSWQGSRYYEAVALTNNNELLHLGFSTNSTIPNFNSYQSLLDVPYFAIPINFGLLLFVLIGILISLLIIISYSVSNPLKQLAQACSSLFLARDAYSAVIRGGLKVPVLSASEVKRIAAGLMEVRRQYDGQFFARAKKEEELQQQRSTHAMAEAELSEQFQQEIASARQSLTELQARESDEEFLASLVHLTDTLSSRRQVCQKILDRLNDKYPTSVMHAAFLMFDDKSLIIESSIGLDDRALQTLKRVDHLDLADELFRLGSSLELGLNTLRERGLQELALQLSLKKAVYLPLSYQKKNLGMLAVYFPIQGQTVNDRIRLLKKVVESASRQLYQMSLYLEELEASRTDPLTGFRNRKYFHEIIPQVIERASIDPENLKFSVIMIDADHFKKINDGFGHQIGDEVLRVISNTIESSIRSEDQGNRPLDYLIRFGGEEFLVVLEKTDAPIAEKIAERLRLAMESKVDWPGGLARCTVSIGLATFPDDGSDIEELLKRADTALYYVKNELGRNAICHSRKVPKTFQWAKATGKIAGELGVFEPSALLQALASTQRSGVLTVVTSQKQNCWILFDKGSVIKARVGSYKGTQALTEFLSTFQEDGNFQFQEKNANNDFNSMLNLDDSYKVSGNLTKILMDAALAKDHFDAAQSIISSDQAVLKLVDKDEFAARLQVLARLPDPPTADEFNLMRELTKKIDGSTSIGQIFTKFNTIPSAQLWHAAALLVQHGLALNN